MSLTGTFAHELPDGVYEVKQFARKNDDEVAEILVFHDVESSEVTYMGAVAIPVMTQKGTTLISQPFSIDADSVEAAFAGIEDAARKAVDGLQEKYGAKIVQPKNVTPEMLAQMKKGPLSKGRRGKIIDAGKK